MTKLDRLSGSYNPSTQEIELVVGEEHVFFALPHLLLLLDLGRMELTRAYESAVEIHQKAAFLKRDLMSFPLRREHVRSTKSPSS